MGLFSGSRDRDEDEEAEAARRHRAEADRQRAIDAEQEAWLILREWELMDSHGQPNRQRGWHR